MQGFSDQEGGELNGLVANSIWARCLLVTQVMDDVAERGWIPDHVVHFLLSACGGLAQVEGVRGSGLFPWEICVGRGGCLHEVGKEGVNGMEDILGCGAEVFSDGVCDTAKGVEGHGGWFV